MASVEGAPGTDQAPGIPHPSGTAEPADQLRASSAAQTSAAQTSAAQTSAAQTSAALKQAHSTVCLARSARHPAGAHHHQQLGHRARRPDRVSDSSRRQDQVLTPHPRRRSVLACLAITAVLGLLYLALIELFHLDTHPELIWVGLLVIVFGGAVYENAVRFDALTGQQDAPGRRAGRNEAEGPTLTSGLPA